MKLPLIACLCLASVAFSPLRAADESTLKTQKEKLSYMFGMNFGRDLKRNDVEVDPELFVKGLKDMLAGSKTQLSEEEASQVMKEFQTELRAKQMAKQKEQGEKGKKEGEKFLADNKKKDGVKTTESGLQYKVMTEGKGRKPTTSDTVTCHYRGQLIDGTEFDSSYKRGEPAKFPVTGVIKGWTEALQLMPIGSKWQLYIPSDLAYGERGSGRNIPPNSTLIFDIELIGAEDAAAATPDKK